MIDLKNPPKVEFVKALHNLNARVVEDNLQQPRKVKMGQRVTKEKIYNLKELNQLFANLNDHQKDTFRNVFASIEALLNRSKHHDERQAGISQKIEELDALKKQLDELLSTENVKRIGAIREMENDIISFNDRVQAIQEEMQTQEQLAEKQESLRKMFKRTNRTHGDAFKRIAELEAQVKRLVEKNVESVEKRLDVKIDKLSDKFYSSPFVRLQNLASWKSATFFLAAILIVKLLVGK